MNALNRFADPVYCMMRFIVGLMLACHGMQLVLGMFGGMPGSTKMLTQVGVWIQLVGGFMIAFGTLTRPAAFICSGMFAYAYFFIHAAHATTPMAKFLPIASAAPEYSNHGELAVFYCWVFLFMCFYGPGSLSIDAVIGRKRAATAVTA